MQEKIYTYYKEEKIEFNQKTEKWEVAGLTGEYAVSEFASLGEAKKAIAAQAVPEEKEKITPFEAFKKSGWNEVPKKVTVTNVSLNNRIYYREGEKTEFEALSRWNKSTGFYPINPRTETIVEKYESALKAERAAEEARREVEAELGELELSRMQVETLLGK